MFLKHILSGFFSLLAVSLVIAWTPSLYSITDGWGAADDPYASNYDNISWSTTGGFESQFGFDLATQTGVYCLEVGDVWNSESLVIDGTVIPLLHQNEYFDLGGGRFVQSSGGTHDYCRLFYWEDKSGCPDYWVGANSATQYDDAGCSPSFIVHSSDLHDGETLDFPYTYGGVPMSAEVTCLDGMGSNYVKCQANSDAAFDNCIEDSTDYPDLDDGDLAGTCAYSYNSGTDTEATCDVAPGGSRELGFLFPSHLTPDKEAIWNSGFPTSSFRIVSFNCCGCGLDEHGHAIADKSTVATFTLTQFQAKTLTCTDLKDYDVEGIVRGYMPWYFNANVSTGANETYVYGSNHCSIGELCQAGSETTTSDVDLSLVACLREADASCYDGKFNQDEVSVDYGGICGSCDNTSLVDDIYYVVARESESRGYYDSHLFNSSEECPVAEDNVGLITSLVVIVQMLVIILIMVVVLFILGTLGAFSIPTLLIWKKRLFKQENSSFKYKNNHNKP